MCQLARRDSGFFPTCHMKSQFLRIVFNASNKPNEGRSLNDCLLTGSLIDSEVAQDLSPVPPRNICRNRGYLEGFPSYNCKT